MKLLTFSISQFISLSFTLSLAALATWKELITLKAIYLKLDCVSLDGQLVETVEKSKYLALSWTPR